MKYKVILSIDAEFDINDINKYISFVLNEPIIARKKVSKILQQIKKLDSMPARYRVYPYEPLKSQNIHFLPLDNYLIFYVIDDSEKLVTIARVTYAKREIQAIFDNSQDD